MNWYEGGIAEAVALSKKKSAVFVVYIHGNDENSIRTTDVINEEKVRTKLESDNFVSIKIEAGSLPHQQFTQIYKQTSVPSVYFIGKNGMPLEVITNVTNGDEFSKKIESLMDKNGKIPGESASFIKGEQKSAEETRPDMICENGVCKKSDDSTTSQNLSADEKVERAKVLLEQSRLLKEKEEEENERQKEIERRKVGQEVQKLKRWQEDQELKQIKEERDREKREEQAARERVLAQIAQDKADRAARFASTSTPPSQSQPSVTPQPVRRIASGNTARLQFKLPDGSTQTHDFSSSDTLEKVRAYIRSEIHLPYNDFILSTTFPRREFNESNNTQSLSDLGLVPNAAVLILPANHGTVSTQTGGGVAALFWTLISPILGIFNFLKNFFVGTAKPDNNVNENKRPAETSNETFRNTTKRRAGESTVVRREGNIHRLSDKTDSDDENNTWNGNSTQQM